MTKPGINLDLNNWRMTMPTKKCDLCSHTRAAHVDGTHCALCSCNSERKTFVQDAFSFRNALPLRVNTRKR